MTSLVSPIPLPDESLVSFVVRGERLQGRSSKISQLALRNHRICVTPYGRNHEHRKVWGFAQSFSHHASDIESLSFLNFFQPFERDGMTNRPNRKRKLSYEGITRRHLSNLKGKLSFCPLCVKADHDRLGFSYWRLSHQVRCNEICEEHLCWLIDSCPYCNQPVPESQLPQSNCRYCGIDLVSLCQQLNLQRDSVEELARIASASRLLVTGQIRESVDLDYIRRNIRQRVRCRVPGQFNNVARYALERLGHDRLNRLEMHPWKSPTLGWPAIYLGGRWPDASPLIELLLYGLFGKSEDTRLYWSGPSEHILSNPLPPAIQLNMPFLRHLYHADTWCEAYENAGLSTSHAVKVCSAFPGLKSRINEYRRRRSVHRLSKRR